MSTKRGVTFGDQGSEFGAEGAGLAASTAKETSQSPTAEASAISIRYNIKLTTTL
jgi:hypothetical protein